MAEDSPKKTAKKDTEFNPRWKGYVLIAIASLVNFASISNIEREDRQTYWAASMTFGLVTFALSVLVLIQDRSQRCLETFHFSKAKDGYFEGITLLLFVVWWIIGTAYTTRAGGIAYVANNIYFSSWLALFSCVFTLNEWSASKDILSIAEMTSISTTLKSWWLLSLTSLVVLGTCVDLDSRLGGDELDDAIVGIAMATASFLVSFFFILIHYDFIASCQEGGWLELSSSFFLVLLWTIFLAITTQDQGVAATLSGSQCSRDDMSLRIDNCTIVLYEKDGTDAEGNPLFNKFAVPCSELPRQVPGSNLYFAAWTCFFASLNIAFRWKAQQALQFAQTQQEKQRRQFGAGNSREENALHAADEEDESDL